MLILKILLNISVNMLSMHLDIIVWILRYSWLDIQIWAYQ